MDVRQFGAQCKRRTIVLGQEVFCTVTRSYFTGVTDSTVRVSPFEVPFTVTFLRGVFAVWVVRVIAVYVRSAV